MTFLLPAVKSPFSGLGRVVMLECARLPEEGRPYHLNF